MTDKRTRPRLWHHDYLHLRPLARDLEQRIRRTVAASSIQRVLDLGSGASPYRAYFGDSVACYVRFDLSAASRPGVLGRAEALPFAGGSFDAVLSSQVLQYVDDPVMVAAEIRRVTRTGGHIWVTCHGAWPEDSAGGENRFGAPDLYRLFAPLGPVEVIPQGGVLALPPALTNVAVRQAVRAAERRFGPLMKILRLPATVIYTVNNLVGRLLERLAAAGPLRRFLGVLDRSMPMNYLVVGRRE